MNIGNIVKCGDTSAIVLALTKDGNRAKLHVYGADESRWLPVKAFTVDISGDEQCWKCSGSGNYYSGGAVVNGVYTGKIGVCFACQGKGVMNDADRKRCHTYWHRSDWN